MSTMATMNTEKNNSRVLGAAFLLQIVVSVAAMITEIRIKQDLIVPGNMGESLINIADNAWLLRLNILGEMLATATLIFLGAMLYVTLKKQNEKIAVTALIFYGVSAGILAFSRLSVFALLRISEEYVLTGHPASLLPIGSLALESMDYGIILMGLPVCLGAILFFYLFYTSGMIPRVLSLWGCLAMSLLLAGILYTLSAWNEIPFFFYIPYIPVEPAIGIWLLVKGVKEQQPAAGEQEGRMVQ